MIQIRSEICYADTIKEMKHTVNSSVSVQEKKLFLEWLLYQFDSGELEWLLEEMVQDESKLEMIRFVDSIENCPKGLSIKFGESSDIHFLFFKGRIKSRDAYTAFHELQLHRDEAYFVKVDFPDKASNLLYQTVMEANETTKAEMEQIAEDILQKTLTDKQSIYLEEKVNQALDERDELAFRYYSEQWKNIKKM